MENANNDLDTSLNDIIKELVNNGELEELRRIKEALYNKYVFLEDLIEQIEKSRFEKDLISSCLGDLEGIKIIKD